jgi:4-hydroxybutyryl-CoA dehydratase/vinylacetyl-CoA-Delta-isomerase
MRFREITPLERNDYGSFSQERRSVPGYIESLRGRNLKVDLMGEQVSETVDHPIIRPSINAVAETYELANSSPELASVNSL